MSLKRINTIADLRARAKQRVPRVFFDYIDGGAGEEWTLERNRTGFRDITLYPRTMIDVSTRKLERQVFGQTYAGPIGVAPVGLANLGWAATDTTLAGLAHEVNMPYCLSTVASTSLEDIAPVAGDNLWFQLYMPDDDTILQDLLARAERAGVKVLLVTVDVPVPGSRYRDYRNGFTLPFRPSLPIALNFFKHPAWVTRTFTSGRPDLANLTRYGGSTSGTHAFSTHVSRDLTRDMSLRRMKKVRKLWPHKMAVKGVLTVKDAEIALNLGADGVVVSNHGARQLDSVPSSIEVLPRIADKFSGKLSILFDSGIRTGSDIVKAYSLGADYVLAGRPFIFGAAAGGAKGARLAYDVLTDETSTALALIGCTDINKLDRSYTQPC